jgi:hypothetical protein
MTQLTSGIDDQNTVLLADLNWQLVNGLAYFAKVTRPEIGYAWLSDVLLYAPALVADNVAIGRDIALTDRAHVEVTEAYGPLLPIVPDPRVPVATISGLVRDLPRGTRYVLCVLKPAREFPLDARDLGEAVRTLTGGAPGSAGMGAPGDYAALAGIAGQPAALVVRSPAPFRESVWLDGVRVDVRMEAWLEFDTIRRMGFGQVVAARRHTLIVERGVSFAAFDAEGRPLRLGYAAGLFAPQPRYLVRR